jgi:thiol-disulfide isomerase/thioredoxin
MLLYVALRLLLSATFLLSAYTKAIDFSSFEVRLLDTQLIGWSIAPYLAATFIFAEYLIGFYFLSFFFKNKALNYLTAGFLLVFTLYLFALLATKGNDVNCGCMGESIAFTPWQAIVKNLLSLGILLLVFIFEKKELQLLTLKKWPLWLVTVLAGIGTAFTLPPIGSSPEPLDQAVYFNHGLLKEAGFYPPVSYDFDQEKSHFIGFLSMSCGHCRIAADRISLMQQAYPEMPIFLVLNGDSTEVAAYRQTHGIEQLPYTMLGATPFMELAGNSVPVLYIVKNDSIRYQPNLFQLNGKFIHDVMR